MEKYFNTAGPCCIILGDGRKAGLEQLTSMHEIALPAYLAHDLDAWKKGVEEKSRFLDCLWGELYGSINIAEINDGAITHEQAQYLRDKYLWGKDV